MLCLLSGAVEAGIAHGLKKRAAGLLPPQDTQSLLLKLTRLSEPAAELVKKLSREDETNKDGSKNLSPGNYIWDGFGRGEKLGFPIPWARRKHSLEKQFLRYMY